MDARIHRLRDFPNDQSGSTGTEMPANGFEDSEIRAIIAYLRSLAPPKHTCCHGDAAKGKEIFYGRRVLHCHMVQDREACWDRTCRAWVRRARFLT